jgi:hypothetical protein
MPEGGNGALTAEVCSVVYLEKEKNVGRKFPIGAVPEPDLAGVI